MPEPTDPVLNFVMCIAAMAWWPPVVMVASGVSAVAPGCPVVLVTIAAASTAPARAWCVPPADTVDSGSRVSSPLQVLLARAAERAITGATAEKWPPLHLGADRAQGLVGRHGPLVAAVGVLGEEWRHDRRRERALRSQARHRPIRLLGAAHACCWPAPHRCGC